MSDLRDAVARALFEHVHRGSALVTRWDEAPVVYREAHRPIADVAITAMLDWLVTPGNTVRRQTLEALEDQWGGHPPTALAIDAFLAAVIAAFIIAARKEADQP